MKRKSRGIRFLLTQVAEAFLGLLRAELEALASDFRQELGRVLRIIGLATLVGGLVFWGLGLLIFAAIEGLAQWLPRWAAALILAGVVALVAGGLALRTRRESRRLRSPGQIVSYRIHNARSFLTRSLGRSEVPAPSDQEDDIP